MNLENFVEQIAELAAAFLEDVGIYVRSGADVGMAEPLAHHFKILPGFQ